MLVSTVGPSGSSQSTDEPASRQAAVRSPQARQPQPWFSCLCLEKWSTLSGAACLACATGVTNREQRGAIGMIKLAVLDRVFAGKPDRIKEELDRYESELNAHVAAGGNPSDKMAAEVGRWYGEEEGSLWSLGLRVLMPLLLNVVSVLLLLAT